MSLIDVPPSLASEHVTHCCHMDAESPRDLAMEQTGCTESPYLSNGVIRELRVAIVLADLDLPAKWRKAALFGSHVGEIVGVGANPQVRRPDAWRVVATMKDGQSGWDWSDRKLIGPAMGARLDAVDIKDSVAVWAPGALPLPASAALEDIVPEDRPCSVFHAIPC